MGTGLREQRDASDLPSWIGAKRGRGLSQHFAVIPISYLCSWAAFPCSEDFDAPPWLGRRLESPTGGIEGNGV